MTEEQIKGMSTEELRGSLKKYKEIEVNEDLKQYIRKILINSVK